MPLAYPGKAHCRDSVRLTVLAGGLTTGQAVIHTVDIPSLFTGAPGAKWPPANPGALRA
jgi:hypothetical protein